MFTIPSGIGQPLPPKPLPNGFQRMAIQQAMAGFDDKNLLAVQVGLEVVGTTARLEAVFTIGTEQDAEALESETWITQGEAFKSFCEKAHVLIEGRKGETQEAVLDAICEELVGRNVVAEVEAGVVKAWSAYVEEPPTGKNAPGTPAPPTRRRVTTK